MHVPEIWLKFLWTTSILLYKIALYGRLETDIISWLDWWNFKDKDKDLIFDLFYDFAFRVYWGFSDLESKFWIGGGKAF